MLIQGLSTILKHTRCTPIKRFSTVIEHSPLGTGPSKSVRNGHKSSQLFYVYPEVADAIASKKPVVALESTIITHGMPYPHNLSVAKEVIKIVRENGAIPATVAVFDGQVHVGLSEKRLEHIAQPGNNAVKTSRRDLPYVLSKGLIGGTTVSGTMVAAEKAGIHVFVTGGIGGVHRGAQASLDVSADLTELGRTPVAVVCAGAKSILDIQLTLEYLETQGVTVATFGKTNDFPAFFTAKSGFESTCSVQTPQEAAKLIDCSLSFGLGSGLVIAVPIPDSEAAAGAVIETAIQQALKDASASGISGKEVTPYLLQRVHILTDGKSLQANKSLIRNNAKVGSQIAVELSKLRQRKRQSSTRNVQNPSTASTVDKMFDEKSDENTKTGNLPKRRGRPFIVGGSNVDFIAIANGIIPEASNPGKVRMTFGGVGRNMAEALTLLGMKTLFVSAIGGDHLGAMLLKHCEDVGMSTEGIHTFDTCQTGTYSAVLSTAGDFTAAVGDMDIHNKITSHMILGYEESIKNAPLVIVDGNVNIETTENIIQLCAQHNIPVWFEPTCIMKATSPFQSSAWQNITYASPNVNELQTMSDTVVDVHSVPRHQRVDQLRDRGKSLEDIIEKCVLFSQPLMTHIHCLVITLGKNGILVCRNTAADLPFPTAQSPQIPSKHHELVSAVHFPAPEVKGIVNVTGAGDSVAAAMVMSIIKGYEPEVCVKLGLMAAMQSLQSKDAIAQSLAREKFNVDAARDLAELKPTVVDIDHLR